MSKTAEPRTPQPDISVVIPVYNGARTVGDVVERVEHSLVGSHLEVILVDDGSADDSWEVISSLAETSHIRGLRFLKNYGQHAAVVAGLQAATGRWVVTIDDDGENDPADIPDLIAFAEDNGHDLVFAERIGRQAELSRRWGSRIVNGVVVRVFKAPEGLTISNYRVMSAAVTERIAADETQYPYVNGLALEYSGRPGSLPVEHGSHRGGGSRYTLRTLLRLLSNILFSYSIWAYRMLVGVAMAAIALSGVFSMFVLIRAGVTEETAPGWASLVLLLSVMSIANLIALTVIGEYVVRNLRQSRRPPIYLITEER